MTIFLFIFTSLAFAYWIVKDFQKNNEYPTGAETDNLKPGEWRDEDDHIHTESNFN